MDGSEQTRGFDLWIAEIAERQHGVIGRSQLVEQGLGEDAIEYRLRAGRLHRLCPGAYAVGHRMLSREARWMAVVLAAGPSAVLSHRSAAALWRIRDPGGGPIEITSPRKTRSRGEIRRHCARLPPDEVTVQDGIRVTTVPRTIFDLAAVSRPEAVESALRQAEYLRLYDSLSLEDLIGRYPGHRGNRVARAALASLREAPGELHSRLEERFLAFLDAHQLPRPHLNAWLEAQGRRYKVDCLWPVQRQIAELDSWQAHGTRSAFQADKSRDRRLRVAGYLTTRITRHQLDNETAELAADLRTLLTR